MLPVLRWSGPGEDERRAAVRAWTRTIRIAVDLGVDVTLVLETVRVHQHAEMGRGEVDFDEVVAALASIDFDGVVSSCVFGWEEQPPDISVRQREKALTLIDKHYGGPFRPSSPRPRERPTEHEGPVDDEHAGQHRPLLTRGRPPELTHWIAGAARAGSSGRFGEVTDPATGAVSATVPFASDEEVSAAVAGAVAAFPGGVTRR